MSKQLSFAIAGVMLSLGMFSADAMADPKHKHGHRDDHHHYYDYDDDHHHHKRKYKHKHREVIVVESRPPRYRYYHRDRVPSNSVFIQIGNLTYLKVDDHYYRRSNDRYVHVDLKL
ncbi:hypothetical protein [Vibrio sp. YIC-376]|uniref:hypothetical protein n=1 Tax=Vibrio sp. YIC-376 TaxID=3136162 RepID=UPI00402ABF4B